jgi:ParB family transcriptional regulator, chromosome partitioning protein
MATSREDAKMDCEIAVDPFRCRMWELHGRLDEYLTEESCRSEIESFQKHGQLLPVLGRRIHGDPDFDIELIYGARRLFVAQQIRKTLRVKLCSLGDREALVALDIENRHRKDVSPYERGLMYSRWLRTGLFESQDHIARMLGISASQVSRLLKLARLPSVIANAFESPVEICEGWGAELLDAWENETLREKIRRRARSISSESPRPPAQQVFQELMQGASVARGTEEKRHDEVVHAADGRPLFRIRRQRRAVAVLLPAPQLAQGDLERIKRAIVDILQSANSKIVDREVKTRPYLLSVGQARINAQPTA